MCQAFSVCVVLSLIPPHLVVEFKDNLSHSTLKSLFSYPRDSVESVNDGLFHTVELLIQNRSLSLVVDNGAQKSLGKLARQPSVDHNTQLYIGGEGRHTHLHQVIVPAS